MRKTRYFRQVWDNGRVHTVWRLRPRHWGERWDGKAREWVTHDERFQRGLIYMLYVDRPIDLEEITEEEANDAIR